MINQETIADASRAISFADDAREAKFVRLVQDVVDPEDLARIGALLPTLLGFVATLEADYSDFLTTT